MSRSEGFAIADVSTALLDDEKVRRLARRVGDPARISLAMTVYVAVLLGSWREGRRVTPEQAAPLWLTWSDDVLEELRDAGLLDKAGRIPTRSWAQWYEPARERRQRNRDRWSRYNASRSGDTAEVPRGSRVPTATSVPTVPTVPSEPPARAGARGARRKATDGERPTAVGRVLEGPSFRDALAAAGYPKRETEGSS